MSQQPSNKFLTLKECLVAELQPTMLCKTPEEADVIVKALMAKLKNRILNDEAFALLISASVKAFMQTVVKMGTLNDENIINVLGTTLMYWENANERFNNQLKTKPE